MKKLRVLVACEFSGVVRDAFTALGHDAVSCDLLPSDSPGKHYQGNVLDIINDGWDMMIAHPPCTYLSYAANHVWNCPGRESKRNEAMNFFLTLASAAIPKICVENPQGYPSKVFRKPDQIVHPFYFGEPVKKRTCLWLKNLNPLVWLKEDDFFGVRTATDEPEPVYFRHDGKAIHWTTANHGGHQRSKTFRSIALAMAEQWGGC